MFILFYSNRVRMLRLYSKRRGGSLARAGSFAALLTPFNTRTSNALSASDSCETLYKYSA